MLLATLAVGGFIAEEYLEYKTIEMLKENPDFNEAEYYQWIYQQPFGMENPLIYMPYDIVLRDEWNKLTNIWTDTTQNKLAEEMLNTPIWEMELPLGEPQKNSDYEEHVAGFNKDWLLNMDHQSENNFHIGEHVAGFNEDLLLNIDHQSENNFRIGEHVAGFNEDWLLHNEHPTLHLDLPLTPNVRTDKNIRSGNVFGSEVLKQIRRVKKAGYAAKHYTITPKSLSNTTNVTQSLDIKLIMAQLEKEMRNELHTSPEGVYK